MSKKSIPVLFENSDIIIINKPTGISVTKDRSGLADVLQILTEQVSPAESFLLVHRLDKETSGALIIAKNKAAQSFYSREFAARQIDKLYLTIVQGPVGRTEGIIKAPIARSKNNPQAMRIHPRLGKPAITFWQKIVDFGPLSLLAVQPITGRTHQIRIHMHHRGFPLAIDSIYAKDYPILLSDFKRGYRPNKVQEERPLIERLTLHAYQIQIPLNVENKSDKNCFTAPLDKKFAATIKMLTKHGTNQELDEKTKEKIQRIVEGQSVDFLSEISPFNEAQLKTEEF